MRRAPLDDSVTPRETIGKGITFRHSIIGLILLLGGLSIGATASYLIFHHPHHHHQHQPQNLPVTVKVKTSKVSPLSGLASSQSRVRPLAVQGETATHEEALQSTKRPEGEGTSESIAGQPPLQPDPMSLKDQEDRDKKDKHHNKQNHKETSPKHKFKSANPFVKQSSGDETSKVHISDAHAGPGEWEFQAGKHVSSQLKEPQAEPDDSTTENHESTPETHESTPETHESTVETQDSTPNAQDSPPAPSAASQPPKPRTHHAPPKYVKADPDPEHLIPDAGDSSKPKSHPRAHQSKAGILDIPHTTATPQCSAFEKGTSGGKEASKYWVFENKQHKVDYSHMAMISRLPPNSTANWIMVWQVAKLIEGAKDQTLWAAFSDTARKWSVAAPLPIPKQSILWSPVLHYDEGYDPRNSPDSHVLESTCLPGESPTSCASSQNKTISLRPRKPRTFLFYTESTSCLRPSNPRDSYIPPRYTPGGDVKMVFTYDGIVWSEPKTIYAQAQDGKIPKVIANQLVVHPGTGHWILPVWNERPKQEVCKTSMAVPATAGVLVSVDRGSTWVVKGGMLDPHTWLIEGSVAVLSNGDVLQYFRTIRGALFKASSRDGGLTWSRVTKTTLPNPDSKINLVSLMTGSPSQALALAFNDRNQWARPGLMRYNRGRSRLKVAVSNNDAKNWTRIAMLEQGEMKLYFHYPTIHQDGCRLLVAYSIMQARPAQQRLHGVGGIRIAELSLKGHVQCTCD